MTQTNTAIQNLLVIDSQVTDWQSLAAGVGADTAILILDSGADGLTQLSDYLSNASTQGLPLLQSIQIISHGSAGSLQLGSSTITKSNLSLYTKQLAKIGSSLTDTGDILLYGCNVAAGQTGLDFINQFAALSNADVAASNDITGSATLNGNWQLEANTGTIEANTALTSTTLKSYTGTLATALPRVQVSPGITPEESGATGSFTFTLDSAAPVGGLTINYSLAGTATPNTDYSVTAGTNVTAVTGSSFTIAAGQTTATLAIKAVSDGIYDPNETIDFTLVAGTGYSAVNNSFSFDPKVDLATGSNPYSVSVGDFNRDGKTDLVVANVGSNTVSVLLRNADNTGFDPKVDFATGTSPGSVTVGDFNRDGKTDLAAANYTISGTVSVLLRNAANTGFDPKVDFATGLGPVSVSVGDFNGDGKLDLAAANPNSNTVSVLLRNAANTGFDPKVDVATGLYPVSVSVGDFNGDGKTDLAVANRHSDNVSVLLRNAANTGFDPKVDFATGLTPLSVSVGDFNGDGKTDLAVANANSQTVSVLLRNAANTGFDPKVDFATGQVPSSVSVGDFNGDGKTDLAVANYSNTVSVLLRNAANTGFDPKVDFATGLNPSSVSVGDFNGDGKADLAAANLNSNTVSVLLNNSTATASLTITTNALPTLTAFVAPVSSGNEDSPISITFTNLLAQGNEADSDGTVDSFVVKAVSSGSLKIGTTAATATLWNASTNNSIDATHFAYWTPALNAYGTLSAFTAVAKDNGGDESITAIQTTVAVTAVIDAPTLTAFTAPVGTGNEDSQTTITVNDLKTQGNEADSDGTVDSFVVKTVSSGSLKIGTTAAAAVLWNASTNNSIDATHLAYWTPGANANGTLNAFTVVAKDNGGNESITAIQTTVAVTAVIDAPTLTAFTAPVGTGNEDSQTTITVNDLKTQGNEADSDGTVDSFVVKTVSSGSLKIGTTAASAALWNASTNNTIDATHFAYWTPALNAYGTLSAFTVVAKDNGGNESITAIQATVAVTNFNDAPTFTAFTAPVATGYEDSQISITVYNLKAQGNDADSDGTVDSFVVKAVSSGSLKIGTSSASAALWNASTNNSIDATHSAYWIPALNAYGTLNAFTAVAKDNGGLESTTAIQTTVAVTAVIDAPTLTTFTNRVATGNEDSQISIAFTDLKTQGDEADSDGSVDSFVVKAVSSGSLKIGTTAATAAGWNSSSNNTIDATHLAYWTPDVNANGTLNAFTVVAKDNGGVESTSAIQTTVAVTAVNDAPTLTAFTDSVASGKEGSQTTITISDLKTQGNEADSDGTVDSFVVKTVSSGSLKIGTTAAAAVLWNASTNNIIDATHQAFWTPVLNAYGTLSAFTAVAKDNSGVESTTAIQASIYVYTVQTLNGTQGNDTLNGDALMNSSYDTLNGLAGNDTLNGLAGNDILIGGLGNDILDGGTGNDTMTGGLGNDSYLVDSVTDVVIETSTLATDIDIVKSVVSYTLGANLENLVLTGNLAINGTGNALNNTLTGNVAANSLTGGLGRDTLVGGAGNDIYNIDASDSIVELANGGIDTVQIASSYTLVNNTIENATLTGIAAANLVGNQLGNVLIGNSGDNELKGGGGADSMAGGAGNDTYVIDNVADTVTEAVAAGKDTVISQISYNLGNNLEGLRLLGTSAINGTGNALDNLLVGNTANNRLSGGAGADQLMGGDGDDTYYIDISDKVVENLLEGSADLVFVSGNWTLGDNLENLVLTGTDNFNGTGNEANNNINGNSGDNILDGQAGVDTMDGGDGNDIYLVDNSGDVASENDYNIGTDLVKSTVTLTLGQNIENLSLLGVLAIGGTGNNLDNVINGNAGRNILDGGSGADTLLGGAGADDLYSLFGLDILVGGLNNDTYYVRYDNDNIIEQLAQGTDTIVFDDTATNVAYAYTLGANLENLTLLGGNIDGHGNSLNNRIIGSNGNNLLDGGAGNDVLGGLKGNDTYLIDNINDQILELLNEGTDEAFSTVSYTLALNVDNLSLTGASAINGTGNISANRMIGNNAVNVLDGLDGNDVLFGEGGNDILLGGNGNDALNGGIGNDKLEGGAGIDIASYVNMAAGVKVDLTITTAQNTGIGGVDILIGIENIDGSNSGADALSGNGLANRIYGYGGNDTLRGGAGNDSLSGGEGDDALFGDTGNDHIDGGNGVDLVSYYGNAAGINVDLNIFTAQNTIGSGLDTLANIENVEGSNTGNDSLTGDENNNILRGFGGNDVLEGGVGGDTLEGGSGNDTADFSGATEGVFVELLTGIMSNDGFGSIDTLSSIENLIGGSFDDLLWGDSGANSLNGGAGTDNMAGGNGSDTYFIDNNLDIISETNATSSIGGIDKVYSYLSVYTLGTNIENGAILNKGIANLTGNSLNNNLSGGIGNNKLNGAAGNDILIGGAGKDMLTGGLGNDNFDFNAYSEMGVGLTRDSITDFVRGQDKVDLSTIDPNAALVGNQAFTFIATATAFSIAGQVRYSAGIIAINTDTDAATEYEIQLTGVIPAVLAATDFVL